MDSRNSSTHEAVPFSAGTGTPQTAVPGGACDCHVHVYSQRFPVAPGARLTPPDASVADYRRIQQRIGTQRVVLVTPSTYGNDNRSTLEAMAELGDQARGVVVIDGNESDDELQQLKTAPGVCGIRLNLSLGVTGTVEEIDSLARRIADWGWHLQLLMPPGQLAELGSVLRQLPVQIVFDHFARIAPAQAGRHAAHQLVLELLAERRAWVKLSGGYLVSPLQSSDDPALDALARGYLDTAPDRVLWGSDWPHATASAGLHPLPDDAHQIDRLASWTGDARLLRRVLVDNPAALYRFSPSIQ